MKVVLTIEHVACIVAIILAGSPISIWAGDASAAADHGLKPICIQTGAAIRLPPIQKLPMHAGVPSPVRPRSRRPILVGALLGLGAIAIAAATFAHPRHEPTYKGWTMHEWLQQHYNTQQYEALIILGTNNLPLLIQRIGYDEKSDRIISYYRKLQPWLKGNEAVAKSFSDAQPTRRQPQMKLRRCLRSSGTELPQRFRNSFSLPERSPLRLASELWSFSTGWVSQECGR